MRMESGNLVMDISIPEDTETSTWQRNYQQDLHANYYVTMENQFVQMETSNSLPTISQSASTLSTVTSFTPGPLFKSFIIDPKIYMIEYNQDILFIIFQFFGFETWNEVVQMGLVCKSWYTLLHTSIEFWQQKILDSFHKLEEIPFSSFQQPFYYFNKELQRILAKKNNFQERREYFSYSCNRLLKEWFNDWVCYWNSNFLTEEEDSSASHASQQTVPDFIGTKSNVYVFERPIRVWRSNGVAHQQHMELLDFEDETLEEEKAYLERKKLQQNEKLTEANGFVLHDAKQFEWYRKAARDQQEKMTKLKLKMDTDSQNLFDNKRRYLFRRKKNFSIPIHFDPCKYWPHFEEFLHHLFPYDIIRIDNVVQPDLAKQFSSFWLGTNDMDESVPLLAFHGTHEKNVESIIKKGLLIPGQGNDITVAHGSRYGVGIYTSIDPRVAISYCEGGGKIFVCAILVGKKVYTTLKNNIIVSFNKESVLPCWMITFKNQLQENEGPYVRLYHKYDIKTLKRFYSEMLRISKFVNTIVMEDTCFEGAFANSSYPLIPCLFKWKPNQEFNLNNFSSLLGIHPAIWQKNTKASVKWKHVESSVDLDAANSSSVNLKELFPNHIHHVNYLQNHLIEIKYIMVGKKQMNPVPIFIVGLTKDREYLTGFMTGLFKNSTSSSGSAGNTPMPTDVFDRY